MTLISRSSLFPFSFRSLVRSFFQKACPRPYAYWRALSCGNISLFPFINSVLNSCIGGKCKLYPPYRIVDSSIGNYTYVSENASILLTDIRRFCSIGPNFPCGWGIHPLTTVSTSPMFYSTKRQNGFSFVSCDSVLSVDERKLLLVTMFSLE